MQERRFPAAWARTPEANIIYRDTRCQQLFTTEWMFSVANMILTLEFTAKGNMTVLHSKQGVIFDQVQ